MMPSKLDAAAALESMDSMDALQSKPLTTIPDEIPPGVRLLRAGRTDGG